ncbi:hypothetical protein SDC9_181096 [bioreactor metagenome]|uniref:Uncharacterized protein n=1 Tax=bioreactor metagenome TaxID=1076179 RepID=A0A645H3M7_9ZZZZ
MVGCSNKDLFDKILLLGCHTVHAAPAASLLTIGISVQAFDIAVFGNGNNHILLGNQVLHRKVAVVAGNNSAAFIGILLTELCQFIFNNLQHQTVILQYFC